MIPGRAPLYSEKWFYQCIQSRYGFNPHHLRLAMPASSSSARVARLAWGASHGPESHRSGGGDAIAPRGHRSTLSGKTSRLAGTGRPGAQDRGSSRSHQLGNSDSVEAGAARVYDDVRMAAKTDPDCIYMDGMEGSTGAGPHLATEETGVAGIAAIRQARRALDDVGKSGEISLIYAGGIRNGGDVAKALALGADAVAIGHSSLMAAQLQQGDTRSRLRARDRRSRRILLSLPHGSLSGGGGYPGPAAAQAPGSGCRCRAGVQLSAHADHRMPDDGPRLRQNRCAFPGAPKIWRALTSEASAMAQVPLAGTQHTVGRPDMTRF